MSKQSAITYEQFAEQYKALQDRTDKTLTYEQMREQQQKLESKHPKYYSKFMLLTGWAALLPGDLLLCLEQASRTGQSRIVRVYKIVQEKDGAQRIANLTYHVAKVLGYNVNSCDGFRSDTHSRELMCYLAEFLFGLKQSSAFNVEVL